MDARTKVFLAVAGGLLLLLMAVPSKGEQAKSPVVVPEAAVPAPAAVAVVAARPALPRGASTQELGQIAEHTAGLSWGRDPFQRPAEPEVVPEPEPEPEPEPLSLEPVVLVEPEPEPPARPPLPTVTGVGLGDNGTWAIIDRRIVQVGDLLPDGFRVVRIERGLVTVELDNEEIPLILGD